MLHGGSAQIRTVAPGAWDAVAKTAAAEWRYVPEFAGQRPCRATDVNLCGICVSYWPMSTPANVRTANERWRQKSQRFPYRLIFDLLPIHTIVELRFEVRLAWLRLTRRGIDS